MEIEGGGGGGAREREDKRQRGEDLRREKGRQTGMAEGEKERGGSERRRRERNRTSYRSCLYTSGASFRLSRVAVAAVHLQIPLC